MEPETKDQDFLKTEYIAGESKSIEMLYLYVESQRYCTPYTETQLDGLVDHVILYYITASKPLFFSKFILSQSALLLATEDLLMPDNMYRVFRFFRCTNLLNNPNQP